MKLHIGKVGRDACNVSRVWRLGLHAFKNGNDKIIRLVYFRGKSTHYIQVSWKFKDMVDDFPPTVPVQYFYRTVYEQPIKAVWSIELPTDVNDSDVNEELIKDNLARKIADEITKYMKITKRPPLISKFDTKRVEYMAEITILVEPAMGG